MLTIEGVGHLIQLLFPSSTGDYSAAVRLSQMIAYPLLFLLPARLPAIHALELETDLSKEGFDNREVDLRKTIAEDSLIQLLLDLLSSTSPDEAWRLASEVTCRYVDADVCLMVSSIGQEDRLQIRTGYDLRRDLYLPGVELNNQQFPLILDALKQGLPVRLPTSSASPDVSSLCQFYNFTSVGYILVLSVISPKNLPILGVILLTPYSERSWTGDDQVKLERVSVRLAQFLHRNQQFDESQADLVYTRQRIDVIEGQLGRYQNERHKFFEFLELIEEKIGLESKAITILAGLRYSNQTVQGTIQNLQDENRELIELIQLTKQLPPAQEAINLQTDLTKTRKEVALLRSALADAESRLLRAKATTQQGSIDQNRIAVVESISQEIHKSATNINEYAHFLMGGSMGDLGDVQRKMIIQVGEGAERLNYLSLELTNAIISHRTPAEIQRTDLDLNQAVMNSIDQSAQFLKELGIKLRVELQDGLPPVRAERKLLASLLSTFIQSADLLQPKNGAALICNRLITTTPAQGISLDLMIDRSSVVDENLPEFLNSTEGVLSSDLELNASQLPVLATLIEDTEIGLRVGGVPGQDAQISLLFPVSVEMNMESAGAEGE